VEFWNKKLDRNMDRDVNNMQLLNEMNWKVITVWECEIKDFESLTERLIGEISRANV
jgi:DNA mismatch endonuclease (patch repair protein)